MDWRREFKKGIKSGLPIGIGYIPVSFTFGFLAVSGGLPIWVAVVISLTNLTSAGQFAGTNLIFAGAGYLEVALTTFVINIRYMLMSLSLSQKLERKTGTLARLALAFGITDETFVVGSLKPGTLTAPFMLGLILMPIAGWNLGTPVNCFFEFFYFFLRLPKQPLSAPVWPLIVVVHQLNSYGHLSHKAALRKLHIVSVGNPRKLPAVLQLHLNPG